MRLVPNPGVHPAGDFARAGQPQRIGRVIAELRVMRAEARVDEIILHRLWVEHRDLTRAALEWKRPRRGKSGALFAERWIVHPAHGCREPQPAVLAEHRI